ncbi:hypothetical protein NGRA_3583, partial [Nosema granulosis]
RRIQKCALSLEYMQKKKLYEGISLLRSIVFVPIEKIEEEFCKVKAFLLALPTKNMSGLKDLISYFERSYILNEYLSRKVNVVERIKHGLPLTTNYAESFNRTLNSKFDSTNPNLFKFLKVIRSLQHDTEKEILSIAMSPSCHNGCDSDYNIKKENLLNIIERYNEYHGLWFLKAIFAVNASFVDDTEVENTEQQDDGELDGESLE